MQNQHKVVQLLLGPKTPLDRTDAANYYAALNQKEIQLEAENKIAQMFCCEIARHLEMPGVAVITAATLIGYPKYADRILDEVSSILRDIQELPLIKDQIPLLPRIYGLLIGAMEGCVDAEGIGRDSLLRLAQLCVIVDVAQMPSSILGRMNNATATLIRKLDNCPRFFERLYDASIGLTVQNRCKASFLSRISASSCSGVLIQDLCQKAFSRLSLEKTVRLMTYADQPTIASKPHCIGITQHADGRNVIGIEGVLGHFVEDTDIDRGIGRLIRNHHELFRLKINEHDMRPAISVGPSAL